MIYSKLLFCPDKPKSVIFITLYFDWVGEGIILPLPKKGDLSYCNNNRGITLVLDIAGKVFFTIMLLKVKDQLDCKMRENQAGLRKGRSCVDQIFSLNQIIEKCLDQQLPCLINFIDLSRHLIPYAYHHCGKHSRSTEYLPRSSI